MTPEHHSVAAGQKAADDSYYEHPREEIAALVPPGARCIVDVGCGAGALGKHLKESRPGVQVRGVEIVPEEAERAGRVLDDVAGTDAQNGMPAHWPEPDCVVFADVLEHLTDPWAVLRQWRRHLAPGGSLVVSLPNIAHRSVVAGLVRGRWEYGPYGILDRMHLRFFTRWSAVEMIESSGYKVRRLLRVFDVMPTTPARDKFRDYLDHVARSEPIVHDRRGPSIILADLCTTQFLIVAGG